MRDSSRGWEPNRKVTFNKWRDCDRCGLSWKEKLLRMQRGVRVCPECYDEPSHEDRKADGELRDIDERQNSPWDPE